MLFSPEVASGHIQEHQFAIMRGVVTGKKLSELARDVRDFASSNKPTRRAKNDPTTCNIDHHMIKVESRTQEGLLFQRPHMAWLGDFRRSAQAMSHEQSCTDWGRYNKGMFVNLLINLYGPGGEFRWHRDANPGIRGVVGSLCVEGQAEVYVLPSETPKREAFPTERAEEVEPHLVNPGDLLLLDGLNKPWHRVVNVTPNGGIRTSLNAAQITS